MTLLLWAAGAVHFGILAANAVLPRKAVPLSTVVIDGARAQTPF
jgi:hypothetical protein